ncbi:MAG: leucine-rich repeat domain-containing protein, partial [Promethearchaeota archaeon]
MYTSIIITEQNLNEILYKIITRFSIETAGHLDLVLRLYSIFKNASAHHNSKCSNMMEGKTSVNRLMRYHDTPLIYQDAEALHALELWLRKPIPMRSDVKYTTFGFMAQDCRVVQLALCGNKLNSLPDCIKNLTALTTLNLNHNKFTTLPNSIVDLPSLTTLDVSHNNLTSALGLKISLYYLNIAYNRFSSLECFS